MTELMIVAEHPSKFEASTGRAFDSNAANLLKSLMLGAGINPSKVHMTYLHKSYPERGNMFYLFDKKGNPGDEMINSMLSLMEEINQVNPNVIMPLGNYALWATTQGTTNWSARADTRGRPTGYTGISNWRGSIVEGSRTAAKRKLVPSYGHDAVFNNYPDRVFLDIDIKKAWRQRSFREIVLPQYQIDIDPVGEDLVAWERKLLAAPIIVFDIEYIGSRLICCSFCVDSESVLVVPNTDSRRLDFIRRILTSGVPLGAQNGMFDCSVLEWHFGMELMQHLKYDTMLAAHASYIELPKDLGTLCSMYTDQPCYWTKHNWKDIREGRQPESTVYGYCGIDSWVTYQTMRAQEADELQDPAIRKVFDFEMSLLMPLWQMSKRGVRVDHAAMAKLRAECNEAVASKGKLLADFVGREINVMSGAQVGKLLFEDLKLKPRGLTKKGYKTDDKVLAEVALTAHKPEEKAILKLIREIRTNRSLISKFCDIELDNDGRMRSHYSPAGTGTGRLASKAFYPTGCGGNGQNFPRDKRVRSIFIPDEGCEFFYHDLERAESLVVAYLTGDPLMLEHHGPGKDAHTLLAMNLFDCSFEEASQKDKRYMGKQTRHAGNYMEGWRTFMINVNKLAEATGVAITAAEAKMFIQRYRDLHVYLGKWWRWTEAQVRTTGKLYNLLGRPRQFFDRYDSSLPTAVAFVPQSTVGDTLNIGLIRCYHDKELNDMSNELLMQIHDAIGGQVPKDLIVESMQRMERLMTVELEVPRSMTCPTAGEVFTIPIELAHGPNWAAVKKWTHAA